MNDLPLTLLRLGLLALLWIFIFSIVGVLRSDLYGTAINRRSQRRAMARQEKAQEKAQERADRQAAKDARRATNAVPAGASASAGAGAAAAAFGTAGANGVEGQHGPVAGSSEPSSRFGRGRRHTPSSLVVTEGPLTGVTLALRGSGILIGRNPECALVLDDDYASGRHARLFPGADGWLVEDTGSTNGTFLDGTKLTSPRPVEVGSQLRIGQTVIELRG